MQFDRAARPHLMQFERAGRPHLMQFERAGESQPRENRDRIVEISAGRG
jgi:hypothetical protein